MKRMEYKDYFDIFGFNFKGAALEKVNSLNNAEMYKLEKLIQKEFANWNTLYASDINAFVAMECEEFFAK